MSVQEGGRSNRESLSARILWMATFAGFALCWVAPGLREYLLDPRVGQVSYVDPPPLETVIMFSPALGWLLPWLVWRVARPEGPWFSVVRADVAGDSYRKAPPLAIEPVPALIRRRWDHYVVRLVVLAAVLGFSIPWLRTPGFIVRDLSVGVVATAGCGWAESSTWRVSFPDFLAHACLWLLALLAHIPTDRRVLPKRRDPCQS